MIPRPRRLPVLLALFLNGVAAPVPAQDPGDVSVGAVIDEASPEGPIATTMRDLEAFHDEMVKHPPRVWLPPAIPVSNGLWPMGWTGGVDDPSGGAVAQGLRNTWTNLDTLAYTQHVFREHRRGQRLCSKCNVKHH